MERIGSVVRNAYRRLRGGEQVLNVNEPRVVAVAPGITVQNPAQLQELVRTVRDIVPPQIQMLRSQQLFLPDSAYTSRRGSIE
jgi:hypothetical protein